jgi:signal transduction histidine kinase
MDGTEKVLRQKYDKGDARQFLADAIAILATSVDFKTTIENLAKLATSQLADWCAVFSFENEQTIRRLTVVGNEGSIGASHQLEALYPLDLHSPTGPGHVLRTGEHQLVARVTDDMVESLGFKPDELLLAGGRKPSSYLCVPLAARGRIIGAIAFVSADSERLVDETDLSLARDLGCAAAVAMDNARLYRQAQEANRLKDEFVAMVSHELRTPLTPILGCIHLLRTAKLSEANFVRALEMIERNAKAQVQIVEDLLDVSRIVAGKLHLAMKSIDVVPVVEAAVDSVRSLAEGKSVRVITNFEDIEEPIDGDPDRLQQVIWNLLSNAVKFTPPDGRIEISVKKDGDHVCIQVTDTGIGIPSDFLPYIFDRFRQADESNSRTRSGLGLGLAIVRHLVELHHGFIEAASPGIGQGAIFTLKFPFHAARKTAVATS